MQGLNRVWRSAVTESTAWLGGLLWHFRQAPIPACPMRLQAEHSPWLCLWALVQLWLCLQSCKARDLQLALGLDFPTTVGEALSGLFCSVSAEMCTSLFSSFLQLETVLVVKPYWTNETLFASSECCLLAKPSPFSLVAKKVNWSNNWFNTILLKKKIIII